MAEQDQQHGRLLRQFGQRFPCADTRLHKQIGIDGRRSHDACYERERHISQEYFVESKAVAPETRRVQP